MADSPTLFGSLAQLATSAAGALDRMGRSDAAEPVVRSDSVFSRTIGLGVAGADKVEDIAPAATVRRWGRRQLDAAMERTGPYARLVKAPVVDAVSPGFQVGEGDEADALGKQGRYVQAQLIEVGWHARHLRGAWLWPVFDDDGDPSTWREPMEIGPERKLLALHVVTPDEARPVSVGGGVLISDPRKPGYGKRPRYVRLAPRRAGMSARGTLVHTSRLIYIPGITTAVDAQRPDIGYDLSVMDVYWDVLGPWLTANRANATAIVDRARPWVRLAPGPNMSSPAQLLERVRTLKRAWSVFGMAILRGGKTEDQETFGRDDISLAGIDTAMTTQLWAVAAVEGIIPSRWAGVQPSGLSGQDQTGEKTYESLLGQHRQSYSTALLRLVEMMRGPADREVSWNPYVYRTYAEAADEAQRAVQVLSTMLMDGVITVDEYRRRVNELSDDLPLPKLDLTPEPEEDDVLDLGLLEDITSRLKLPAPVESATDPEKADVADEQETYQPPEGARGNAQQVLDWREEHGDEVQGMTEVGWRRARQLASGDRISREVVAKMAGFNRHRQNAEVSPDHEGEPWKDAGHVAWLGWGGTTGIDWARGITGADD